MEPLLILSKVVIGYTVPAGLAIIIIIAYYLFAHQPKLNPFRNLNDTKKTQTPYAPNPVDELILGFLKTKFVGTKETVEPSKTNTRLQKALLKVHHDLRSVALRTNPGSAFSP